MAEAIHQVAVGAEDQSQNTLDSSTMIGEITNEVRKYQMNTQNVASSAAIAV